MKSEFSPNGVELKADVVVIGAGGGGLAAAVAAAETGAMVLVLEKRSMPGGNARLAGGLFAAESHLQKRLKIDATKDGLFKMDTYGFALSGSGFGFAVNSGRIAGENAAEHAAVSNRK